MCVSATAEPSVRGSGSSTSPTSAAAAPTASSGTAYSHPVDSHPAGSQGAVKSGGAGAQRVGGVPRTCAKRAVPWPEVPWSSLDCMDEAGKGSYGTVWRARWMGAPVAVKVLAPVPSGVPGTEAACDVDCLCGTTEVEALALASPHPNIVQVYGVTVVQAPSLPRSVGIVMELEGTSLATWLQMHRPAKTRVPADSVGATATASTASPGTPPGPVKMVTVVSQRVLRAFWRDVADILCQAAAGLAHCHSLATPVVHADIKPGNILVQRLPGPSSSSTPVLRVKLADFGGSIVLPHGTTASGRLEETGGGSGRCGDAEPKGTEIPGMSTPVLCSLPPSPDTPDGRSFFRRASEDVGGASGGLDRHSRRSSIGSSSGGAGAGSAKGRVRVTGTPRYMPAEQWRGETLTPAADVYALGVTALACFAGRVTWRGHMSESTGAEGGGDDEHGGAAAGGTKDGDRGAASRALEMKRIRDMVCRGEMPVIPTRESLCPASAASIIRQCLSPVPSARPSARQLVSAFGDLRAGWQASATASGGGGTAPETPPQPPQGVVGSPSRP